MTPVYQEHFRDEARGIYGDCARAVIASLLDRPLATVPHFLQDADSNHRTHGGLLSLHFHDRLDAWLLSQGYEIEWRNRIVPSRAHHYCFISGKSPRGNGLYHAVVGQGSNIVHDPHPQGGGLLEPENWLYGYLVRLNAR